MTKPYSPIINIGSRQLRQKEKPFLLQLYSLVSGQQLQRKQVAIDLSLLKPNGQQKLIRHGKGLDASSDKDGLLSFLDWLN